MKNKKIGYIINMAVTILIFLLALIVMIGALSARAKNEVPNIFGLTIHVVVSDSMSPDIEVGDFVLAKKAKIEDIEEGDFIIFRSADPSLNGMIVIHEAIHIEEKDGKIEITTKGTNNTGNDRYPVTGENLISVYQWHSSFIGKVLTFLSDVKNLLLLVILIVSVSVALKYGAKIVTKLKKGEFDEDEKRELTEDELKAKLTEEIKEQLKQELLSSNGGGAETYGLAASKHENAEKSDEETNDKIDNDTIN